MSKLKKFFTGNLALQLLFAVAISLLISYGTFQVLSNYSLHYLSNRFSDESYQKEQEKRLQSDLQTYVDENSITTKDSDLLRKWALDHATSLTVYYDHKLVLDTDNDVQSETDSSELAIESTQIAQNTQPDSPELAIDSVETYLADYILVGGESYNITFSGQAQAQVVFFYYGYYRTYTLFSNLCLGISALVFLCFFLLFVQRKIHYIHQMADELRILEGGNLNYEITEKGNDELFLLANGINEMRKAILQKQEREIYNREANKKLVTALSHDIRTPLTSLVGYLELLRLHRYESEEQLTHFLETSIQKSYQIKELSDKLFEYFIVSEKTEDTYTKEPIPIAILLDSLSDNQLFDLEQMGYQVITNFQKTVFLHDCLIDIEFIQRVLDNLLSNMKKYADPAKPVTIEAVEKSEAFYLTFKNSPLLSFDNVESTGIGIKTCEKIMREHGGTFISGMEDELFVSTLSLPISSSSQSHPG